MKTITTEVKSYITKYEAVDGKRFDNAEDCKAWEKSYKCTIEASWQNFKKVSADSVDLGLPWGNGDDEVYIVKPTNLDEIVMINAYINATTCDDNAMLTAQHIGETVVLNFGYDHDYCSCYIWEQHLEAVKKYMGKKMAELEKITD